MWIIYKYRISELLNHIALLIQILNFGAKILIFETKLILWIRFDFTEVIFELEIFWSVAIAFGFRKCRCMTGSWEAAEMVFCLPLLLLMNSKWSPWAKRLHERRSNCYHPIFTSNEIEGNTSNYHSMECNSSWATFLKET